MATVETYKFLVEKVNIAMWGRTIKVSKNFKKLFLVETVEKNKTYRILTVKIETYLNWVGKFNKNKNLVENVEKYQSLVEKGETIFFDRKI